MFAFILSTSLVVAQASSPLQQKVAAVEAALYKNTQMLGEYTWQQQETVSVRGDVKNSASGTGSKRITKYTGNKSPALPPVTRNCSPAGSSSSTHRATCRCVRGAHPAWMPWSFGTMSNRAMRSRLRSIEHRKKYSTSTSRHTWPIRPMPLQSPRRSRDSQTVRAMSRQRRLTDRARA
jgi:hypothetical protein